MLRRLISIALFALMLLVPAQAQDSDPRLHIVATTTQAADLARVLRAGAPGIRLTALMGAGVDPHLYQPTESDIVAMNEAQLVVYSGLRLEDQFETVFEALAERGVAVHALSQPVAEAGFIIGGFALSDQYTDVDDPHFWFDPRNWQLSAADLAETLARIDPDYAEVYRANAAAYIDQLDTLFVWADESLRSIAEGQRHLVTSHDAFQYFGAAFGWRMRAIQGLSTEDEAGVGDIQSTVDFVAENEIPVLFVESSIPPDTVEAVIEALAAQGWEARLGSRELYGDAMDAPGTFGGAYIGMIALNALTIAQSYQCMGVEAAIPDFPPELEPQPPAEIWDADCDVTD